jgi:hypothetical protein
VQIRRSFNPETGAVEAGRPVDMSEFENMGSHRAWWQDDRS